MLNGPGKQLYGRENSNDLHYISAGSLIWCSPHSRRHLFESRHCRFKLRTSAERTLLRFSGALSLHILKLTLVNNGDHSHLSDFRSFGYMEPIGKYYEWLDQKICWLNSSRSKMLRMMVLLPFVSWKLHVPESFFARHFTEWLTRSLGLHRPYYNWH